MDTLQQRIDGISPPRDERMSGPGENRDERIQDRIASKLHQAADNLFGKTGENQAALGGTSFSSQASSWLHSSADYIEQIEPEKVKTDITEHVRRNPGRSLLVAGAAGLILGAIFRRR